MQFFKYAFLGLVCSTAVFTGCKKDDSSPMAVTFNPITRGSTWTYHYTENNSSTDFTLTVSNLPDTTVASGRKYTILTASDGSHQYLSKSGTDDYRFASFPSLRINNFEELFLKEVAGVNDTWTNTTDFTLPGSPFPLTATLTYKIKEKDISRTVNGTAFKKVTHVHLNINITIAGDVGGGEFYYAEGIGLIENNIDVVVTGQPPYHSTQQLRSYVIK